MADNLIPKGWVPKSDREREQYFLGVSSDLDWLASMWGDSAVVTTPTGLASAVAVAGTTKRTIRVTVDQLLSAPLNIPANVEVVLLNGSIINHGAFAVAYAGDTAQWPKSQVFNGTGTVTGLRDAYTSWFAGDVQKTVTAASTSVTVDTPFGIANTVTVDKPLVLTFSAEITTTVEFAGDAAFKATSGGVVFENPMIDAANVPRLNSGYNGSQEPQGVAIYFMGSASAHIMGGAVRGGNLANAPFVGVFVKYADDVTVDGVTVQNAGHQVADLSPGAIYCVYSLRPVLTYNRVLTPGLKGIVAATGCDDALFEGNYVSCGQSTGFAAYMGSNIKGWRCVNNKSKSIFGIKFDGGALSNADFTIMGNSIEDADNGGIIIQGGYSGIVSGNTVAGWSKTAAAAAIEIFGDPSNPAYIGPLFITGNTIRYSGTALANVNGVSVYSAATYGPASDITVNDNHIEGAYIGVYTESGTGADHTRVKVSGNTIKNCVYDGVHLKGQGVDVIANTVIAAGNNGVFVTGFAGDTAADGISIKDNDIVTPTAYGVYVYRDALATSLDIEGNRINAAGIGIVFNGASIPNIGIAKNHIIGTTGSNSISLEAEDATTHKVSIADNFTVKRISWTVGTGAFVGPCRWNVQGTAMVSTPAGVIVETGGAGSPEGVVSAPMGSVYHRTDGGPLTTLYNKVSGAGTTGWIGSDTRDSGIKAAFTPEGGLIVRLTNKTGAASVKGTVITTGTVQDNSFAVQTAEYEAAGIVYDSGVADGSECWVVVSGIAEVLMKDGIAPVRGDWCKCADTDGRAEATIPPTGIGALATAEHFKEIGHCLESKTAGTDVLAKVLLHFN